jgi:transposase
MDSHTHSVQRLEVVTTGRRRRWSEAEKRRIVAESLERPRAASETARRHGITPTLLFSWRRALAQDLSHGALAPSLIPLQIAAPCASAPNDGRIEIMLMSGIRLLVDDKVDPGWLRRLVAALEGR